MSRLIFLIKGLRVTMLYILFLILLSTPVFGEEYLCNYSWEKDTKSHSVLIDVDGKKAVTRWGSLNVNFSVVSNSNYELLIYKEFTKENSGMDYPIGFSIIVLDKKSGAFAYSNTFAVDNKNNHALGKCEKVYRNDK